MSMLQFTLDGIKIHAQEGQTILQAALANDYYIPNLCSFQNLMPAGVCKMCLVQIEGKEDYVPACSTLVENGMNVISKTEELKRLRKMSLELLCTAHPEECGSCPKNFRCELEGLEQYLGAARTRYRHRMHVYPVDKRNPLFLHDFTRCILCQRCIRTCQDVREVGVLKVIREKNGDVHIGIKDGQTLADAGCRFCGACVEVCPTGALQDREGLIDLTKSRRESCVPCQNTCPAGIDVPGYIRLVKEGKPQEAAALIREKVPFPEVLGTVCMHTCETVCRRGEINDAMAIRNIKQYAARQDDGRWKERSRRKALTGKKAAVIGGGPAGLTCAYYLNLQGHEVTVFEKEEKAGGMLTYAIPTYRLSKEVVEKEVRDIVERGVSLRCGMAAPAPQKLLEDGYDCVVAAVGTHKSNILPIEGKDSENVWGNLEFLQSAMEQTEELSAMVSGKKVVVLGGGNVAVDCAGTAVRLGAASVTMLCLEARDKMTASEEEIEEVLQDGVVIKNEVSFRKILEKDGKAAGVDAIQIKSFTFDENGAAHLETEEGSEFTEEADIVIFAVGQSVDLPTEYGLAQARGGRIVVDDSLAVQGQTAVFACGDAVTGTKSVIEAIAAGRKAAAAADLYLGGDGDISETLCIEREHPKAIGECEGFAAMTRDASPVQEANRCLQCDLRCDLPAIRFWNSYESEKNGSQTEDSVRNGGLDEASLESRFVTETGKDLFAESDGCIVAEVAKQLEQIYEGLSKETVFGREGGYQLVSILKNITMGKAKREDMDILREISFGMIKAGDTKEERQMGILVQNTLYYHAEEYEKHILQKRCDSLICNAFVNFVIVPDLCTGCTDCVDACDEEAILGKRKHIHIIDPDECIHCGACVDACEEGAIQKFGKKKPPVPKRPVPVGKFRKEK